MEKEKDILDNYQILTELKADSSVLLVRDHESKEIQVMKYKRDYNLPVIQAIKEQGFDGIPHIYYYKEEENVLLTVEEYIHGRSLWQIYEKEGLLSEDRVLTYFLALCRILERLHKADPPIIHRDIKPDHIILTNDHVIKLIDFNGAKLETGEKKQDTVMLGTVNYAAPEQYGFGKSDHRTDIYQIGITMNQLLTGRFPIDHVYGGELGNIIRKCTEYNADKRYSTVTELENALKTYREKKRFGPLNESVSPSSRLLSSDGDSSQDDKEIVFSWLPPGYRTRKPWKMLLATCVYALIIYVCFTMDVEDSFHPGQNLTGIRLWLQRITAFSIFITAILSAFNYRNILRIYPQKYPVLRILLLILTWILYSILAILLLSALDHLFVKVLA